MKSNLLRLASLTGALALITGTIVPVAAQPITAVYVLEDNGWYETGGADFPDSPFRNDVVRDVDVAWLRIQSLTELTTLNITSSHPSIVEVGTYNPLSVFVALHIHEPAAPTPVTITANTVPPTFEKAYTVTVYPRQRVDQVRIVPQKPFYVVGEEVELEVTMRYAEPFGSPGDPVMRSLRLDFDPALEDVVYIQNYPTWGSTPGAYPSVLQLPGSKVFRYTMKLLRAQANQAIKASVMCAITATQDAWESGQTAYDDCHSGTQITYFNVLEGPRLEKLALTDPIVASGGSTTGRLDVSTLAAEGPATISLTSSDPSVTVPATLSLSGSGNASATFPITTTMAPGNRTVTISATKGEQTISAKLNVQGVLVRDLTVAKPELRAEETFELIVTLDQPAPGPITVTLTSSDPRAVPLPTQVTFSKGEISKRVSIRAGTATRTTDVRLAGSIAGSPARETAVRISAGDATRLQENSGATRPRTTDR